ncbi:MAG: peptidase E [Firmicutes bacterium]|nr:peptidase E [Bacillota bacterium]
MKIITAPRNIKFLKQYTMGHREKFGNELFYIPDGLDALDDNSYCSIKAQNKLRNLKSKGKFSIEVLSLQDYLGKPGDLFRALEKAKTIYVEGGNSFDLSRLMKVSGFSEWAHANIENPDLLWVGASAGIVSTTDDLSTVSVYDNPEANHFGLDTDTYDGIGLLKSEMILPHYKSKQKPWADGRHESDVVDSILQTRMKNGQATIPVHDETMFVKDLGSGEETLVVGSDFTEEQTWLDIYKKSTFKQAIPTVIRYNLLGDKTDCVAIS